MKNPNNGNIVEIAHFIQATRDAGYKSITNALAELIDNSFEAGASKVDISFVETEDKQIKVIVVDDGSGMTSSILQTALRFGGSTRFNSRTGTGRFGMGLPNSSLSQARRVDVFTWKNASHVWWSYLDVDEIVSEEKPIIPLPKRIKKIPAIQRSNATGTAVVWSNCDRIKYRSKKSFLAKIRHSLGRLFRKYILAGKKIYFCDRYIPAVDPLFIHEGDNLTGSEHYGHPLQYEVEFIGHDGENKTSTVSVQFVQLPIERWHGLSNDSKRFHGISKNAGVSIIRAGREIDYGWFFMGKKRKENYDDWWRCEICFEPDLDALFGVTNTKQSIRPTESLNSILSLDLERIAHELNRNVRKRYAAVKSDSVVTVGVKQAIRRDVFLPPPPQRQAVDLSRFGISDNGKLKVETKYPIGGMSYRIIPKQLDEKAFYVPFLNSSEVVILLNKDHPFFGCVYSPFMQSSSKDARLLFKQFELMILAAARAECMLNSSDEKDILKQMREEWSKALAMFLE